MGRCENTKNLAVHHRRTDGGNGIENAEVLCTLCHRNTKTYGDTTHVSPPPFPLGTKILARFLSLNRCQCTRESCGFH
jgi:hypothetical protein